MTDEEYVENTVITALCMRKSGVIDISDTSLIYKISEDLKVNFDLVNRIFTKHLLKDMDASKDNFYDFFDIG